MGVVYAVRDPATGARRALKTLLRGAEPDERLRFQREAELLAQVVHPNVVRIHAADLAHDPPYLVQDFLAGGSLRDRLRQGGLEPAAAVGLVRKLAHGLAAVHRTGVLHRDLKPHNVLLTEAGEPALVDFGLARRVGLEERRRLTQSGVVLGTPAFMAPEQVADPRGVGPEADVYGLGAILYMALTGRPPFEERSTLATLEAVMESEPVPPTRLVPGVPAWVEAVCLRALAKRPEDRYPSAEALCQALEAGSQLARRGVRFRSAVVGVTLVGAVAGGLALVAGLGDGGETSAAERFESLWAEVSALEEGVAPLASADWVRLRAEGAWARLEAGGERLDDRARLLDAVARAFAGDLAAARAAGEGIADPRLRRAHADLVEGVGEADPRRGARALARVSRALPLPELGVLRVARWAERPGENDAEAVLEVASTLEGPYRTRGVRMAEVHALRLLGRLDPARAALARQPDLSPELAWTVALDQVELALGVAVSEAHRLLNGEELEVLACEARRLELARAARARIASQAPRGLQALSPELRPRIAGEARLLRGLRVPPADLPLENVLLSVFERLEGTAVHAAGDSDLHDLIWALAALCEGYPTSFRRLTAAAELTRDPRWKRAFLPVLRRGIELGLDADRRMEVFLVRILSGRAAGYVEDHEEALRRSDALLQQEDLGEGLVGRLRFARAGIFHQRQDGKRVLAELDAAGRERHIPSALAMRAEALAWQGDVEGALDMVTRYQASELDTPAQSTAMLSLVWRNRAAMTPERLLGFFDPERLRVDWLVRLAWVQLQSGKAGAAQASLERGAESLRRAVEEDGLGQIPRESLRDGAEVAVELAARMGRGEDVAADLEALVTRLDGWRSIQPLPPRDSVDDRGEEPR
jgi:hypothetical protein